MFARSSGAKPGHTLIIKSTFLVALSHNGGILAITRFLSNSGHLI
jgi:hypothetical protein